MTVSTSFHRQIIHLFLFLVVFFVTRQAPGCWDPKLKEGECDNVLSGQSYCTAQGVVTDDYGAMVE
jgi:hypothetical protein